MKQRKIKNQQKARFPDILNVLFSLQCTLTSFFFTLRRGSWVLLFSSFGLSLSSPAVGCTYFALSRTRCYYSDRGFRIRLFLVQHSRYRTHTSRLKETERPLSRGVFCVCMWCICDVARATMWYRRSDSINHLGAQLFFSFFFHLISHDYA